MTTENQHTEEVSSLFKRLGLMSEGDIITLELQASRRLAARVQLNSGRTFFVKQRSNSKEIGDQWLASCLEANQLEPSLLSFRPKIHFLNEQWFVSDFIDNGASFKQVFDADHFAPLATSLAKALAGFHSALSNAQLASPTKTGLGVDPQKQVKTMGPLSPREYADSPGLDRDLFIRTFQQSFNGLSCLSQTLERIHPVHGDLHGGNILLNQATPEQFHIIDWDRAGLGDPCWDLGTLFSAIVQRWIALTDTSIASLPQLLAAAQPIWDKLVIWFTAFMKAYWRHTHPHIKQTATVEKIILVAGQALLQRCKNILSVRGQFSQRDILILSLAGKFLQQPAHVINALLPSLKEVQ